MAVCDNHEFGTELCHALGLSPDMVKGITITVPAQGSIEVVVRTFLTSEMRRAINWQELINGAVVNVHHHEPE